MKKNLLALILALVLVAVSAVSFAEEVPVRPRGHYPERGITLDLTQADEEMGIVCTFNMGATQDIANLPIFSINYTDTPTLLAAMEKFESYTEEQLNDEDVILEIMIAIFSCNYGLYQIGLFDSDYINEVIATDGMLDDQTALSDMNIIAENDGYHYILFETKNTEGVEDADILARIDAASVRAKELIDTMTFQPVVFGEGELTQAPDVFPAFEVQDINGSTITNEIFYGKDLTVVNIWGTFCNPCIEEMPELAAWSAEMPENMQIIGLVSDLTTADDLETLELAQAICEATGAEAYTHLIAEDDFTELLNGVIGVPTTLFVDGQGNLVGEPIVGANVPLCQKTANELLGGM